MSDHPKPGVVCMASGEGGQGVPAPDSGARFSDDRLYRYALWRELPTHQVPLFGEGKGQSRGTCLFIMLNPSTAGIRENDPTVSRCIQFAQAWGYGRLVVCNLFAFRTTYPSALHSRHRNGLPVIGPSNDQIIRRAIDAADLVVCAWGRCDQSWRRERARDVRAMIPRPYVLGLTDGGDPRHPLYVRKHVEPQPWGHKEGEP